jgi:hypothetical protein
MYCLISFNKINRWHGNEDLRQFGLELLYNISTLTQARDEIVDRMDKKQASQAIMDMSQDLFKAEWPKKYGFKKILSARTTIISGSHETLDERCK